MTFRERIMAVLNGEKPDRIPFFSFSELIPRGEFERFLRNSDMGLLVHSSPIASGSPNVPITKRSSKIGEEVIHHTPLGDISFENYTNIPRITSDMWAIKTSYFIKDKKDYDPLIYMINDTVHFNTLKEFKLKDKDLGSDGILHVLGLIPPYTEAELLLGLERWSYEQFDNPREFSGLLEALKDRTEKAINLLSGMDYKMVIYLGDISDNFGPKNYFKYEIPHYDKCTATLKPKGHKCGVHAHATLLKRQKKVLAAMNIDFIEAYTPPPYSDLPIDELREAVGENVAILINFPETIFYEGYDRTKKYTLELLKGDPCYNKALGFTEMGMMGVDDSNREIFKDGFRAVIDALEEMAS